MILNAKKFGYLPIILSVALAISVPHTKQNFIAKEVFTVCSTKKGKKTRKGGRK